MKNAQTILQPTTGIRRITLAPTSRGEIVGCSHELDIPDRVRGAANDIDVHAFVAPVVPIDSPVRFAALRAEFPLLAEAPISEVVQFPTPPRHITPPPPPLAAVALSEAGIDLRAAVEAYENELIHRALTQTRWNKQHAARLLGINRTTLVEMVKRKGLSPR